MIRRLPCWLGWHDWYTLNRRTKPSGFICDRMYCDNCPFLEDGETICLNCGKPVKSPVFIDKDRGGNSGYTRKDIGKYRGIAGYRRRTITNKGTKIIIE